MLIEITSTKVAKETITITGTNLDNILLADDLYKEINSKPVKFVFDRANEGHMKYLWKVAQSQKASKEQTSYGAKIDKLIGQIVNLSTAFKK